MCSLDSLCHHLPGEARGQLELIKLFMPRLGRFEDISAEPWCAATVLSPKDLEHLAVSFWVSASSDCLCSSCILSLSLGLGTIPPVLTCWSGLHLHFFLCPKAKPSLYHTNVPVQWSVLVFLNMYLFIKINLALGHRKKWRYGPDLFGFPDSLVGKESPAMQEILVWFLGREDPLEKG